MGITRDKILVGNIFPTSLIRRSCMVEVKTMQDLINALEGRQLVSFWGHTNTLGAVKAKFGLDLTPRTERPAVSLTAEALPTLGGEIFPCVWVVSPDYRAGFRPAVGVEVSPEDILDWHVVLYRFL